MISANGRLLLGLKGSISELDWNPVRSRLTAGLLANAERGELALTLPIGLVRDPSGIVVKDPNLEVQGRLELLFQMFLKVRTVAKVMREFNGRGLVLPRRDRHGDNRAEYMRKKQLKGRHQHRSKSRRLCRGWRRRRYRRAKLRPPAKKAAAA